MTPRAKKTGGSPGARLEHRPAAASVERAERLKVEAELRESEERYRQLIIVSPDAIAVHADGKIAFVNPAAVNLLGAESELALLGKPALEMVHPEDRASALERIREALASGRPAPPFRERFLRLDGTAVDVEVIAVPVLHQGRPGMQVIARDITERRKAEDALRESEERFRAIFENGPVGMVLTGREFKFFSANPAFCGMLGYTAEEMSFRTFLDITHPDHRQADRENVERMWRGEIPQYRTEKRYLAKSGEVRWGHLTASLIQSRNGRPLFALAVIQDITEQKKAEETLRNLSERNEAILETVPDIIAEVDRDKRYTWLNKAGRDFFGDDVIGRDASLYFEGEQRTYDDVQPLFDGGSKTIYVESWQRRRDGRKRLLAWWCRPLRYPDGRPSGALSSARDITEVKESEEKIRSQLEELMRWHEVTVGRETRILELKAEVNRLLAESGRPPKYASAAPAESGPDKEPSS